MYLVGKVIRCTDTRYLCAEVGSTKVLKCISADKFRQLMNIADIQNVDAVDDDLIIVKYGKAQNKNLYISHKLGRQYVVWVDANDSHVLYLTFKELQKYENEGYRVINAHIEGTEYVGNATPIIKYTKGYNRVSTYNDLYNMFLLRLYKLYSDYSQTGHSKRKPEPYDKMVKTDMHWMLHIMRTFHTAEYNDWMRLLNT